jgi:hypothetical protein
MPGRTLPEDFTRKLVIDYRHAQCSFLSCQLEMPDRAAAVDRLEKSVRNEIPDIQRIFIEAEALGKSRQAF